MNKTVILSAFIVLVLAQLFVPSKMIWDREDILETGKEYKFKTAPVDPTDPFRGKYITLRYQENTVEVEDISEWERGEPVYAYLSTDSAGFAKIDSVSKTKFEGNPNFLKTKIRFISRRSNQLTLDFPFNRFYMEEFKAYDAELSYRESQLDSSKQTYALVRIKNGEAVLQDVLIDGVPIKEIVEDIKEKKEEKIIKNLNHD